MEYLSTAGGEVPGGMSASSVNKNHTIDERTGNMSDITSGGVSAASVGNGTITSERTGNISGPIFGGLSRIGRWITVRNSWKIEKFKIGVELHRFIIIKFIFGYYN